MFEDTQRLVKQKLLKSPLLAQKASAVSRSATQPTSAMATRIAVSAPAEAVRASSVDHTGQRNAALLKAPFTAQTAHLSANIHTNGSEPPPNAVTAQLQAAERMRKAQQAHIDAQQEEYKRRQLNANGVIPQHVSLQVTARKTLTRLLRSGYNKRNVKQS